MVAIALAILAFLTAVVVNFRHRRLLRRYRTLLNGPTGTDLEALLLSQQEALRTMEEQLARYSSDVKALQINARRHIQHVGVVRFNAFPDTGSDLSFAIALLDAEEDGVVFSSLFGRNDSRVYAKPLKQGKSTYVLTAEEQQAIDKARRSDT